MTSGAVERVEDPRVKPGQCGVSTMIAGREWICVAEPHDGTRPFGGTFTLLAVNHYYVPRYARAGQ